MPQVSFPQILPTTDYETLIIPINASALSPCTSLTAFYRGAPTNYITDLIVPHQFLDAQITTKYEALELITGVGLLGGLKGG